jgi:transposase-like protein
MIEHYYCPHCGNSYLGIRAKSFRFVCTRCGKRWYIREEEQPGPKKRNIMKWMSEHCDLLEEIPDGLQKDPFY